MLYIFRLTAVVASMVMLALMYVHVKLSGYVFELFPIGTYKGFTIKQKIQSSGQVQFRLLLLFHWH